MYAKNCGNCWGAGRGKHESWPHTANSTQGRQAWCTKHTRNITATREQCQNLPYFDKMGSAALRETWVEVGAGLVTVKLRSGNNWCYIQSEKAFRQKRTGVWELYQRGKVTSWWLTRSLPFDLAVGQATTSLWDGLHLLHPAHPLQSASCSTDIR